MNTIRREYPELFDDAFKEEVVTMMKEALECEMIFAHDILSGGVAGLPVADIRKYLEFIADQRLGFLSIAPIYHSKNPLTFMELQDIQELTNFFERNVSSYQVGISGGVAFTEDF